MRKFNTTFSIFTLVLAVIFLFVYYQPFGLEFSSYFPIIFVISILVALLTSRVWNFSISTNLLILLTIFFITCIITNEFSFAVGRYIIHGVVLASGITAASLIGKELNQFVKEYASVSMILENNTILKVSDVRPLIESEFARGTRYEYPISLVWFEGITNGNEELNHSAEILASLFKEQIAANQLSKFLQAKSRVTDILVRVDSANEYLLICPGIDEKSAQQLVDRLRGDTNALGLVHFNHKLFSFPKDARSFDAIMEQIRENDGKNG